MVMKMSHNPPAKRCRIQHYGSQTVCHACSCVWDAGDEFTCPDDLPKKPDRAYMALILPLALVGLIFIVVRILSFFMGH